MSPETISRFGGVVGKIYGVGHLFYSEFYKSEKDANDIYIGIYPNLKINCAKYGRDSENFNKLLLILAKLAPFGAKRNNFIRRYINNKEGWRQLPKDPNNIPFGYWW